MADTADRRSEGPLLQSSTAIAARAKQRELRSKGLCFMCGETEVRGRMTCYACSSIQVNRTYLSGLRSYLKKLEIDPELCIAYLDSLPKSDDSNRLKALMELAKKFTASVA